jgi:hypothetical protein
MAYPVYYPVENDVLPIMFDSFDGGTGASITMTGLAVTDIEIYKDGSVTQRASDAGYVLLDTDGIDFDAITGIHGFSIDLGDNTTAGFYEVGPWYHVVVSAITVDAQTVNFIAAAFRIVSATRGLAGTALPAAAADAAGGLPISDAGGLDLDSVKTDTAAILVDTGTTLQAELDAIQAAVITNAAGVDIAADIIALKAETAAILLDTAEIGAAGAGLTAINLPDQTMDITGSITGNLSGSVGSVTGAVGSVTGAVGSVTGLTAATVHSDLDDIQARLPAALTAGGNMKSDFLALRGSTTAADNLEAGATGLVSSTCAAGSTTTSIVTNLTEATDDHYNGRVITFTGGALAGQSSSISDYTGATKTLTVVALTEAPADTDSFVIS